MKSFGHKIDAIFDNYAASGSFTFKYKNNKKDDTYTFKQIIA